MQRRRAMNLSIPVSIRISGQGGQGNILMGIILAEALVKEGYWVVQTQHYGAQVRGGLSFCDVLFDKEPIDFPVAETFNIIYLMHDVAASHTKLLKNNGILFYDSEYVNLKKDAVGRITKKIVEVQATKIAYEKINNTSVSNMVALGAMVKTTNIISFETLIETMKENVKPSFYELDTKAIQLGYDSVEKVYALKLDDKITKLVRGFE
jgi:2-oxoglutarate ferredoxin oxidoreductase subunit gamma